MQRKSDGRGKTFESGRILHAKNIMKPFVLRRLKVDVLKDLPKKTCAVELVEMCPTQQRLYAGLATNFSVGAGETSRLEALMQLRFTANHHLLLRDKYSDERLREISQLILTVRWRLLSILSIMS